MDTNNPIYEALEIVLSNESYSAEARTKAAVGLTKSFDGNTDLGVLEIVLSNDKYSPKDRLDAAVGLVRNLAPTDGVPGGAPVDARPRSRANGVTNSQRVLQAVVDLGGQAGTTDLSNHLGMKKANLANYLTKLVKDGDLIRVDKGVYEAAPANEPNETDDWETTSTGPRLSGNE